MTTQPSLRAQMNVWVDLRSFDNSIFQGNISQLALPALDGDIVICSGHAPLLTALRPGVLSIINETQEVQAFSISEGFACIYENKATVLAKEVEVFDSTKSFPFDMQSLVFNEGQ